MIDIKARERLTQDRQNRSLVDGMKSSIVEALKGQGSGNEEVLKLVVKREDDVRLVENVGKIGQVLALIYRSVSKPFELPKMFQIWGKVEVTKQSDVKIKNLNDLKPYFDSLSSAFNNLGLAINNMPQPRIEFPKVEMPKQGKFDSSEFVKAINDLKLSLQNTTDTEDVVVALGRVEDALSMLANRPSMTATPATNFNINALNGIFKTTTLTVGTSATVLPPTSITNRRSLTIYNNSANTVYLGGNTVSVAGVGQGLPLLASSYSPPFDAGVNMLLYGISSSPSSVTIMEMSNDNIGR